MPFGTQWIRERERERSHQQEDFRETHLWETKGFEMRRTEEGRSFLSPDFQWVIIQPPILRTKMITITERT